MNILKECVRAMNEDNRPYDTVDISGDSIYSEVKKAVDDFHKTIEGLSGKYLKALNGKMMNDKRVETLEIFVPVVLQNTEVIVNHKPVKGENIKALQFKD